MILLIFLWTVALGRQFHQIIAIQERNEIYTSFIPYLSSCDYDQPAIEKGKAQFFLLDDQTIFQQTQEQAQFTFWSPVKNGLNIMLLEKELGQGYDGYIMLDSPLKKTQNRYFLLYNLELQQNTSVTFYEAFAIMEVAELNLSVQITDQQTIYFDNQTIFTQDCTPQEIVIQYFGNSSYLIVCKNTGLGYTFQFQMGSFNNSNFSLYSINLTQKDILTPIADISTNPSNLDLISNNDDDFVGIVWNLVILSEHSLQPNQTFTCYFSQFFGNSSYFNFYSYNSIQLELSIIIDRIYGAQEVSQESRWQFVYSQISYKEDIFFPGSVVSVFVNDRTDIYVESKLGEVNYLNIFESGGTQIANITYNGFVVYYGFKDIFIYNDETGQYFRMRIQRPIFTIFASNSTEATTFSTINITLPCQNMDDVELVYEILWTSPNYPSAKVFPLSTAPLKSSNYIYSFNINENYVMIGPAYDVYVNGTPTLQVTLIDSDIIKIRSEANVILDVKLIEETLNTYVNIVFSSQDTIFSVHNRNKNPQAQDTYVRLKQPCGFTSIWEGKIVNGGFLIENTVGQKCFCNTDFTNCKIVDENEVHMMMTSTYHKKSPQYTRYVAQKNDFPFSKILNGTEIKKNLFGLMDHGYIVTITTNNSVFLVNKITLEVLDMIEMPCSGFNETDGDLYFRQFYSPYLLLFCYEDVSITQYIVRDDKYNFERIIPLYGFRTRRNDTSFFIGLNFAYISVDPVDYIYPPANFCCVLRIDPCEYTVSVLQEIIKTDDVIGVVSRNTIDIALYSGQENGTTFFKIYFSQVYVALNQTKKNSSVEDEEIQVVFYSQFYNFASMFSTTITFNFTIYNLSIKNGSGLVFDEIVLSQYQNKYGSPIYNTSVHYNFNRICGPIFDTVYAQSSNSSDSLFQIQLDTIVRANKLLGEIGEYFLQIIEPSVYNVEDLSLNNLIMVVAQEYMYVYMKQNDQLQMVLLDLIPLPEPGCTYYLYFTINNTAARFISNCQAPNFEYLTPSLTVRYENNTISYSFQSIFSIRQLRQIFTIVRDGQQTLVVGLGEGPMKSKTGKLFLCGFLNCIPLYISSQELFLVSFDAYIKDQFYVIMSLDSKKIEVFIEPEVSDLPLILSNYTVYLKNMTEGDICSVMKITKAFETYAYILISCSKKYYNLKMIYETAQLTIISSFQRYGECSLYDKFRPDVILNDDQQVQVMVTVCNQNQATLKLQSYQTLNSSPTIYTGYLQIFTNEGPMCGSNLYNTIKIIPLSTSISHPLFLVYEIQGQYKLIYSQINGILVDNFLATQPVLNFQYRPLTSIIQFPQLMISTLNPYNTFSDYIQTTSQSIYYPSVLALMSFAIYCFMILINVLFLLCFCIHNQTRKKRNTTFQIRESGASFIHDIEYDDATTVIQKVKRPIKEQKTVKSKISEIELFYIKSNK